MKKRHLPARDEDLRSEQMKMFEPTLGTILLSTLLLFLCAFFLLLSFKIFWIYFLFYACFVRVMKIMCTMNVDVWLRELKSEDEGLKRCEFVDLRWGINELSMILMNEWRVNKMNCEGCKIVKSDEGSWIYGVKCEFIEGWTNIRLILLVWFHLSLLAVNS